MSLHLTELSENDTIILTEERDEGLFRLIDKESGTKFIYEGKLPANDRRNTYGHTLYEISERYGNTIHMHRVTGKALMYCFKIV